MVGRAAEDPHAVRQRRRQGASSSNSPTCSARSAGRSTSSSSRSWRSTRPPERRDGPAEALADQHGVQRGRLTQNLHPAACDAAAAVVMARPKKTADQLMDWFFMHQDRDDAGHRPPGGGRGRQDHGLRRAIRAGDPGGQDRRRAGLVPRRQLDTEPSSSTAGGFRAAAWRRSTSRRCSSSSSTRAK